MANPLLQQAQQEGLCLRLPDNIPQRPQVTYSDAWNLINQGANRAAMVPFQWLYIDKPGEGSLFLIHLQYNHPFPLDGIRYQGNETKSPVVLQPGKELEVHEVNYGFIPGADQNAFRTRRRYRITAGSPHRQLVLVHYSRGPVIHIQPALMSQPARSYPLRMVNEPPMFVVGEKAFQRPQGHGGMPVGPVPGGPVPVPGKGVPMQGGPGGMGGPVGMGGVPGMGVGGGMGGVPGGGGGVPGGPMPPQGMGMPMGFGQQQAMIAQQSATMEGLERGRDNRAAMERERLVREQRAQQAATASGRGPAQRPQGPRVEEEESGDEIDSISTRTLAMTRYKRNHEWMNEVFVQAAFGYQAQQPPKQPFSGTFSQTNLDARVARLQAEIEALQSKSSRRHDVVPNGPSQPSASTASTSDSNMDFTMGGLGSESITAA